MQNESAPDAKARFGQLLDTARREPVVIERHGRAVTVVLSKEDLNELNAMKLERLRTEIAAGAVAVERGENEDYDEENLMQVGEHIKAEGRKTRSARWPIVFRQGQKRTSPKSGSALPGSRVSTKPMVTSTPHCIDCPGFWKIERCGRFVRTSRNGFTATPSKVT